MKKMYLLFLSLLWITTAKAQTVDTVFFENFEHDEDPTINWALYPLGNDTTFVNIDFDGITPYGADDAERQWFWDNVFHAPDTLVNRVIGSFSWLENSAPGNRNWLVLPPVDLVNNSYSLHWKSAPFQMLRYMDGYSVLASTNGNDAFLDVFTDTLFRAASMEAITGDGNVQLLDQYAFTPGYIHANGATDSTYFSVAADSTLLYGYLEPHSVSLEQYAGEHLYLAFVHDSDDDFYLMLDDILIVRSNLVETQAPLADDVRFVTYPNPVQNFLNVMYRLPRAAQVRLQIMDVNGRVVREGFTQQQQTAGEHSLNLDLRAFVAGTYSVSLEIEGTVFTKMIVKQ